MRAKKTMGQSSRRKPAHHRLRSPDTRWTIGVLDHGIPVEFDNAADFWSGVAEVAREQNVNLLYFEGGMLHSPLGFEPQANVIYDVVGPENVDGLIVSGIVAHYAGPAAMQHFCERYAPLPLVTNEVPVQGIPSVVVDFYQGMAAILAHLLEVHGYRRIAFIRGPTASLTAEDRYRAYTDALARHDLPLDLNLVAPGTFFAPSGAEAIHLLFDERQLRPQADVEAIVAANDYMALDALQALHARGVNVPGEVAVTGFDDIERCRSVTPALTTAQMLSYQAGRRLAESLLARLEGQDTPAQVILPAQLVIRESCGCVDPILLRTTVAAATTAESGALAARRQEILAAVSRLSERTVAEAAPHWAERLLDAFVVEMTNGASDNSANSPFLGVLDQLLRQTAATDGDVAVWQNVLVALRRQVLPCLSSPEMASRAENLWQQAQVRIGGIAQRLQMYQRYQDLKQAQMLRKIEQRLITTFDVDGLMQILAEELPRLDIPSCYLAVYEEPQPYAYPQPAPRWSRLILAYTEQGRLDLGPAGQRFLSRRLAPQGMFSPARRFQMIIEPLYFREQQLGFVLFEVEPRHRMTCDALRGQISSALQGALLVQQVKAHAAELARKQYVLDTFMANVPDAIYFKDRGSRITHANKAHAERLGLPAPDAEVGKTDFDFFPEAQARVRYRQEQTILQTGQPLVNLEEQIAWPDGRVDWYLTTKMPLRDEHGEIFGTFGISRDITALKQAEQELLQYRDHLTELVEERTSELTRSNARLHDEIIERRRIETELARSNASLHAEIVERRRVEYALRISEQQYRFLAENVRDGLVIVQNGMLVFANNVFAMLTGHAPEHLVLTDPVTLFHAPEKQTVQAWFTPEAMAATEPQWQAELVTRDGRAIWTEIEHTAIVWDGQPALLLTIRDITSRRLQAQRLEEERTRLQQENLSLRSSIKERYRFGQLVGKSAAMQQVYERIVNAAASDVNVFIVGESGVGKELIARTLHQVGVRKAQAFVPVNCASIPETLFEREFFGHQKGAFTSADRNKSGLFDRAHQGLLFLDEVTELTPGTQAKLLRVLQDGEYTPLGSNTPKQADVLLVAATNKDWQEEIAAGRLRKDFFYRIGVVEIAVPPLRERKDDLPLLIEHLLEQYQRKQTQVHGGLPPALPVDQTILPAELLQAFYTYDWPGNVRELQNVLQRYIVTRDLAAVLRSLGVAARSRAISPAPPVPENLSLSEAVQSLEKRMIADTLNQMHYRIGKTAAKLGMPLRTLQYKIKKYHLLPRD